MHGSSSVPAGPDRQISISPERRGDVKGVRFWRGEANSFDGEHRSGIHCTFDGRRVADVLPWLRHWYGLEAKERDQLASELQKVYDPEIHLTIHTGGKRILVALGTDFTGLERKAYVNHASEILPRLQSLIHEYAPVSKYDVERLGRTFTGEMARITE